jgi:hypothetical protein
MRKIHMLAVALAGAFLALPALAAPNLAGTTWTDLGTDGACMAAFEFRADFSFLDYDVSDNRRTGRWWLDAGTLYLLYDDGENVQTSISDDLFALTYRYESGEPFTCEFMPLPD